MDLSDFLNVKMFQLIVLINIVTNYYTFAIIDDDIQGLKGVQDFSEPKNSDDGFQTFKEMKDFSEHKNSGQNDVSYDDQSLKSSSQRNSMIPVGVIYLMEREIAHTSADNLKLDQTSLVKKERNLKDIFSAKSPIVSSKTEHLSSSRKRSEILEADLLGLPDIEIDTRFYSHAKSVSHSSLDHKSTVNQNSYIAEKYTSSDHSRSNLNSKNIEIKSKNADEELNDKSLLENTETDLSGLNKIKSDNEKESEFINHEGDRRTVKRGNDKQEDDMENGLARSERFKQYTKQKDVSVNRIKYVNNNRRQTGATNLRPPTSESVLTNQNPTDILNPIITQDLLEFRSQPRSHNELNEQGSTMEIGRPGIKSEVLERDGNLITVGNVLPPLGLLLGLETGLKYSKRPLSADFPGMQSLPGIQNLVGAQNLAKSTILQDSTDLSDRSRIEPIGEPLERGGNLLSVGNPIPPLGLSLGLQTGSKHSRRPLNTGQAGSQNPTGIQSLLGAVNPQSLLGAINPQSILGAINPQSLLGAVNPLKSEDQLDYADFNYRSGNGIVNNDLKSDTNLLSVADRLETPEVLLGVQVEPKHARYPILSGQVAKTNSLDLKDFEKSETKKDSLDIIDRSGNEINKQQLERGGKLLSIGNPLPPVGLLLGLQTGSKNTKDSDGNLLTIGNPLPPVGLQLGVQTG